MFKPLFFALLTLISASSLTAATFVVNYYEDEQDFNPGDGICDVDPDPILRCSLRAAVREADVLAGFDRVEVPPPPPGEELSLNLLSAVGGGPIILTDDTLVIGTGPEPVEILGSSESTLPVFSLDGEDEVPVIENFLIRCRFLGANLRGVDGARWGVLRNSIVTGCPIGIQSNPTSDWRVEGVTVEGNLLGVLHIDSRLLIRHSLIRDNGIGNNGTGAGINSSASVGSASALTVENSLITGNEGERGAGLLLENVTRVVVVNSTISGQQSDPGRRGYPGPSGSGARARQLDRGLQRSRHRRQRRWRWGWCLVLRRLRRDPSQLDSEPQHGGWPPRLRLGLHEPGQRHHLGRLQPGSSHHRLRRGHRRPDQSQLSERQPGAPG